MRAAARIASPPGVRQLPRHASTHAAGIVISREPLTEIMPLQRATDGRTTMTQFEMHACEALGLLKFDFLGLINLTILADAVELVKKHRSVDIDVDNLPLDDAADVFTRLSVGDGLVAQIPALIVSLAAGLLVSKGGTRGNESSPSRPLATRFRSRRAESFATS